MYILAELASIRRAEEKQRLKEKKEKKLEKEKKFLDRLNQLKSFPSSTYDHASSRYVYDFILRDHSNAMVKLSTGRSKSKTGDSLERTVNANNRNNDSEKACSVPTYGNRISRRQVSFDICTDNDFSDEASDDDENLENNGIEFNNCDSTSQLVPIQSLSDELVDRIELIFIGEKCIFSKFDSSFWDVSRRDFHLQDNMHQNDQKTDVAATAATSNDINSKVIVVSGTSSNRNRRKTYLDIFIAQAIDIAQTASEQETKVGAIDDDLRFNSIRLSQCLMHFMVPFLSIQEMMYFSLTCKALKSLCNKDMQFRIRRKEGFAMVSHEYSKAKKNEKKKKIKQANVKKMTKKDAFARGGNDGMH